MLSTANTQPTKPKVARILVHSNPLLDKEVRLRQSINPLLNSTDIVYQLIGERLGDLEKERNQFIEARKSLLQEIRQDFASQKPREEILTMSDEELDEYVEANY
jgi:hypothetical protein